MNATTVYKILRPLIDELRQLVSGALSIVKTYYGDNGSTDIAVGVVPVTLASISGIVVGPNQKLVVQASVFYEATAGEGNIFTAVEAQNGVGPFVPIDATGDSIGTALIPLRTFSRSFEEPAEPDTYTIRISAQCADGLTGAKVIGEPPGSGVSPAARLVVQVVSV